MADESQNQPIDLTGMENVVGLFADVFMVATDGEQEVTTLYFFQRGLSISTLEEQEGTKSVKAGAAKCLARILLSKRGTSRLLEALADNQGFVLMPRGEEK